MKSNDDGTIEVTAETVDEAIQAALARLGATQDDAVIEVLSTPRSGVLGLGARPARVRASRRSAGEAHSEVTSPPPAPHPAAPQREERRADDERHMASREEQARAAAGAVAQILELMGEKAEVKEAQPADPDTIEIGIIGDGSGILIGRHGQTLDALEYIVNRVVARQIKEAAQIVIDTEAYRARRRSTLHRMALSKAEQAKREHRTVTLDPMPPRDRRIIHLALQDDPMVTTRSSGEGFERSVAIVPAEGGRGERRGRERETEAPSPGQGGGWSRGQKRIV